jgi:hypothetical protein
MRAWRRTLSTLTGQRTAPVSKIVVTSGSDKINGLGAMKALELKPLPREAYWYFKTIAFGSTGAEEQPEVLASVCMEIADMLNRSFIGANITARILRGNLCPQASVLAQGSQTHERSHEHASCSLWRASKCSPGGRSAYIPLEITQV